MIPDLMDDLAEKQILHWLSFYFYMPFWSRDIIQRVLKLEIALNHKGYNLCAQLMIRCQLKAREY
jgi:hypothetical protein